MKGSGFNLITFTRPILPPGDSGNLSVAFVGIGLAVTAADRLVDFYTGHVGIDLAFIDAIAGDGFTAFPAGSGEATKGEEEKEQAFHVFEVR